MMLKHLRKIDWSPRRAPVLAAALVAVGLGAAGIGAVGHAQPAPPPGAGAERATVSGTVAELFGNHFVLQAPGGRVLVDLGPDSGVQGLRVGEPVSVQGRAGRDAGPFRAESLRRGDGPEVAIRRPPPPGGPGGPGGRGGPRREEARVSPEQAAAAVRALGYTVTAEPSRGPRHYDVPATNPRGEAVRLHVDLDGRPYKEVWPRAEGAARPAGAPSEAEARRIAAAAGFTPTGSVARKDRHAELDATTADGRRVALRVESDGVREANFPR